MDENEVVKKMQDMLGQSKMVHTNKPSALNVAQPVKSANIDKPMIEKSPKELWLKLLPAVPDGGFLLEVAYDGGLVVFCVKELDWQTAMNIDMKAFRVSEKDGDYYAEEYERRHTLSRAILWAADSETQIVIHNQDTSILEQIQYEVLDILWQKYKLITGVSTQEAQKLYEATRRYLNNQAQEGVPIPSIIPETIAICDGWCSLSAQELKTLTAGDWERMQVIRMARADLMGVYTPSQISPNTKSIATEETKTSNDGFDLNEWSKRFPKGHPNRPPGI